MSPSPMSSMHHPSAPSRKSGLRSHRSVALLITAGALVSAFLTGSPATAEADPSGSSRVLVFTRGEAGYHTFRIPALAEANDGTLLAFAEAKVHDPDDWGDSDVVVKRSTDGGRSWGPVQVVHDAGTGRAGNAVPVVDRRTGRIVINTYVFDGDAEGSDVECGRTPVTALMHTSDDNGVTWSAPRDVTDQVGRPNWRMIAAGPGHGIQLTEGAHAGRLVIPGRHSYVPAGSDQECTDQSGAGAHVIYSDDGGDSWDIGALEEAGEPTRRPNEVTAVEMADGTIYFSARDQGISAGQRLDTTSSDGGASFDRTYAPMPDIVTSQIEGSLTRLPAAGRKPDRLVFSITDHPTARERLTLFSSLDDGASWRPSVEVYDGPSAYSDLEVLTGPGGRRDVGVLFEGGERFYPGDRDQTYHHDIYFTRVPEHRLDAPSPGPRFTPDVAGDHHARVSGQPDVVRGRFGAGLSLAGDYAELPMVDDLAFDNGAFTAAAWFRTDYRANNQAIFYAHSRFGPRWLIQAEPINGNRVHAQLSTDRGSTRTLDATGDFVDGQWHHVALVKSDDGVFLYLDGNLAASDTPPGTGSVSAEARTGIRVGARIDGINAPFIGDLDEVQLFATALDAEQVATLTRTNTAPGATPVTHLPLDRARR